MTANYTLSRNLSEIFARRVRKNLNFIIKERHQGEDVHEVTQLVISLLGIIVFPWEANALSQLEEMNLHELEAKGWPHWHIILDTKGDTNTLYKLVRHLRNAASHRRLRFTSDHEDMNQVEIEFEDAPTKNSPPNWRARINASDLKTFCDYFTETLEDFVG